MERGFLVMAGFAGQAETGRLAAEHREELTARFPRDFVKAASDLLKGSDLPEALFLEDLSGERPFAFERIREGGVFAALWRLGERLGLGMEVQLSRIPLRQETVELSEIFHFSPYEGDGSGGVLFARPSVEACGTLMSALKERGIPSALIGILTEGKARRICQGERVRYLERDRGHREGGKDAD